MLYHAKEYNIRVMNLSLAADSTETWQTDPLALAARSAVAAGITVVVAAGNFGQSSTGSDIYGAIGSPGHGPSVITVGSVNLKGTLARVDDGVNNFSPRGPTRGTSIGALRLALALRTDIGAAINAGSIGAGATLLAPGAAMPLPVSTIDGETVNWSQLIFAGDSHLLGGPALFTSYQPIYDPRLTWASGVLRKRSAVCWPGSNSVAANTYAKHFIDLTAPNQTLISAGVRSLTALLGATSLNQGSGLFMPADVLTGRLGSGIVLTQGMVLSEGLVLSESGGLASAPRPGAARGEP